MLRVRIFAAGVIGAIALSGAYAEEHKQYGPELDAPQIQAPGEFHVALLRTLAERY